MKELLLFPMQTLLYKVFHVTLFIPFSISKHPHAMEYVT